ncbi:hypothetical protein [Clostridium cochlearium]|uniref:Uncharacterized protein n=1 Tax=Clostridium cochlearium TaxID=1494 RepID=A0A7Y4DDB0_CLOCO|nr:hypothetical protein [Clostridium cochlearium]NOH16230.1 hypothetical protein [Clostridium cochlearium]
MSHWQNFDFENRIRKILSEITYTSEPDHHLNRPFMTAYQIAIKFDSLYSNDVKEMGYKVGGAGINQNISLAQYIARELSQRIKSGEIVDIEGAFLSNLYIKELTFNNDNESLKSSLVGTNSDHSIFRLITP